MKIALVHDYLKEFGGAERVLETMHEIWPEAPVYTSFVDYDALGPHGERIKKWDVRASWANNWFMKKLHSPLRFLAPWVWESFDFTGYDVVISSSGWYMSKGIITAPETVHICYIHHPPRHLYGYATAMEWQKYLLVRMYATIVNFFLRHYDFLSSQRVDYFIANSQETKRRVEKFYRRDADVIYPPVDVEGTKGAKGTRGDKGYFLCVGRLARAKHFDLAIEACQKMNVALKIVGKGRDEEWLRSKIKNQRSKITFLGEISDEELEEVYAGATALLCPFEDEEFGIVAVEAMGHGVPVVALNSGGLPETIEEGKTGVLFDELTVGSMVDAMKSVGDRKITAEACRKRAQLFSKERFKKEIKEFISNVVDSPLESV